MLHKRYVLELMRVHSSETLPRVMRILAEETVEKLITHMEFLGINEQENVVSIPVYWQQYLDAIHKGEILDVEYIRYCKALETANLFLDDSYVEDDVESYKAQRYEYALSFSPLPEWFVTEKVYAWLEEIVTACGFLWFALVDYAENINYEGA